MASLCGMILQRRTRQEGLIICERARAARKENLCAVNAEIFGSACAQGLNPDLITFEVGCGKGHFLSAYAAARSAEFCVGIDIISERIRMAQRKARLADAPNAFFAKAEASEYLESLPQSVRLDKIFIMFPDPWPKKKHHKNRLMKEEFLQILSKRCQKDTKLFFRTDYREYFDWTKSVIEASDGWELLENEVLPFEAVSQFQGYMEEFFTLCAHPKA